MKKFLVLFLTLIVVLLTSCIAAPNKLVPSQKSSTMVEKTTAEDAVAKELEQEGYKEGEPYEYITKDNYIFLLYKNGSVIGYNSDEDGYKFYLPLGFKMNSLVPEESKFKGVIDLITVIKDRTKYIIHITGYKENMGILVSDTNSPIRIYSNRTGGLITLYNKNGNLKPCYWIDIINDMPDDYQVNVDYNGETYPLINAEQIKKLVG